VKFVEEVVRARRRVAVRAQSDAAGDEAPRLEPGAREQDQRHRHLRADQDHAQPAARQPRRRTGSGAKHIGDIRGDTECAGDESDQRAADERRCRRGGERRQASRQFEQPQVDSAWQLER